MKDVSEVGKLCKSHIIPRFILKKSREKKDRGRSVSYERELDRIVISQTDWKERMLCTSCEHLLKVHYEDFIQEALYLHRREPVLFDVPGRICLSVDNDRLALAFISIFWRAIESSLPEFEYAILPDYMKGELRGWIYGKQIPRNWRNFLSISLVQLIDMQGNIFPIIVTPFYRNKSTDGHFEFVFIFGGYYITFCVPPAVSGDSIGRLSIRPRASILRIEKVRFWNISEVSELLSEMLEADKAGFNGKSSVP